MVMLDILGAHLEALDSRVELILTHVPEAGLLTFEDALALAQERDEEAALELEAAARLAREAACEDDPQHDDYLASGWELLEL